MWNGGQQPNKRRAVGAYPMVEDYNFWVERLFCRTAHRLPLFLSSTTLLILSSFFPLSSPSSFILILLYSLPVGCQVTEDPFSISHSSIRILSLYPRDDGLFFLSIPPLYTYYHPLYPPILIFPVYAQHGLTTFYAYIAWKEAHNL